MWSWDCLCVRSHWVHTLFLAWVSCCSIFSFLCSFLYIIVCHFVLFLLAIALSLLLRFTFDYPLGILNFCLRLTLTLAYQIIERNFRNVIIWLIKHPTSLVCCFVTDILLCFNSTTVLQVLL